MEFTVKLIAAASGIVLVLFGFFLVAPAFVLGPAQIDEYGGVGMAASLLVGTLCLVPGWMLLNKAFARPGARRGLDAMPNR